MTIKETVLVQLAAEDLKLRQLWPLNIRIDHSLSEKDSQQWPLGGRRCAGHETDEQSVQKTALAKEEEDDD